MEKKIEIKNEAFLKLLERWREQAKKIAAERKNAELNK